MYIRGKLIVSGKFRNCVDFFKAKVNVNRVHCTCGCPVTSPYRCPHPGCSRVYASLQSLHKHMKVHSDPSPHKCDYCEASFKKHTQLAVHRAEHTGALPFMWVLTLLEAFEHALLAYIHMYNIHACTLYVWGMYVYASVVRHWVCEWLCNLQVSKWGM